MKFKRGIYYFFHSREFIWKKGIAKFAYRNKEMAYFYIKSAIVFNAKGKYRKAAPREKSIVAHLKLKKYNIKEASGYIIKKYQERLIVDELSR